MARVNIYLPDEMAAAAREAGLNVSALTQQALADALARRATDAWLASISTPTSKRASHEEAMAALAGAREELGD
jgi:post-segregation antitoxin (ccd killing protein)